MFQIGTLIVSLIAFLILFWFIKVFGFGPLAKMLEQRRQHIEQQIHDAEEGRAQAQRLLAEHQKMLDEARREAKDLVESARARADEQARQIVAQAQSEASRLLEENRTLIDRERQEALNAVMDKVSALTVELTTKLLHNHVSETAHEEMLKEAEKKLGELVC